MLWFRVLVEGENFKLKFEKGVESVGFFTTRFVEVQSTDEAEAAAVEMLRSDETLDSAVMNSPGDPPLINVVEIREVSEDEVPEAQQGFTFFHSDAGTQT